MSIFGLDRGLKTFHLKKKKKGLKKGLKTFHLKKKKKIILKQYYFFSSAMCPFCFIQLQRILTIATQGPIILIKCFFKLFLQKQNDSLTWDSTSRKYQHTVQFISFSKLLFSQQQVLTFFYLNAITTFVLICEWAGSRVSGKLKDKARALIDG